MRPPLGSFSLESNSQGVDGVKCTLSAKLGNFVVTFHTEPSKACILLQLCPFSRGHTAPRRKDSHGHIIIFCRLPSFTTKGFVSNTVWSHPKKKTTKKTDPKPRIDRLNPFQQLNGFISSAFRHNFDTNDILRPPQKKSYWRMFCRNSPSACLNDHKASWF